MGRRQRIIRRWSTNLASLENFELNLYPRAKMYSLSRFVGLTGNLDITKKVMEESRKISVYVFQEKFLESIMRGALEKRQSLLLDWILEQVNTIFTLIQVLANEVKGDKRDLFEYIYSKKRWSEINHYYFAITQIHPSITHIQQQSIYAYTAREGFIDLLDVCPLVNCVQLALAWAAGRGHTETVNYLLSRGAKPSRRSIRNAFRYRRFECIYVLIRAGAPCPRYITL